MNRRRLLLICLLLISVLCVTIAVYYVTQSREKAKPYWLASGSYVTYEQVFMWNNQNETEYMTWNVTKLGDNTADLYLVSHGVNVTDGNVAIIEGEANWTVNAVTREVSSSSDSSYVGQKCPFWIPMDLRIGSSVDILYGTNTIRRSESISVLGQQRDCWILEYDWSTASMKRWYDKSSGICLRILVVLYRQDITVTTTETAVSTNIGLTQ